MGHTRGELEIVVARKFEFEIDRLTSGVCWTFLAQETLFMKFIECKKLEEK